MATAARSSIGICGNRWPKRKSKSFPNERGRNIRKQNPGSSPTALHRPRFQGIHPHRTNDACANITLFSAIQRQTGTLAQIAEVGVHPSRHTVDSGRCAASDSNLHGALQHRAVAQHDLLAGRQAEIHAARDRKLEETKSPTTAPAGGNIAACTFLAHDYNDLAR